MSHERRPLPGGNRRKSIGKELLAAQAAALPVEVAGQMGLALIVEHPELSRVRLPASGRRVDVVQGVPDLVAHHVRGGRRPRAHHDLAFAVGPRARVPGGPAGRQGHAAERGHVVRLRDSARPDEGPVKARG